MDNEKEKQTAPSEELENTGNDKKQSRAVRIILRRSFVRLDKR